MLRIKISYHDKVLHMSYHLKLLLHCLQKLLLLLHLSTVEHLCFEFNILTRKSIKRMWFYSYRYLRVLLQTVYNCNWIDFLKFKVNKLFVIHSNNQNHRMQDVNPLKKINLEQYQKPKTLIVVHYKGKRISVPLLGDCKNLTQMLYHHIDKFQQTVLKSDQNWQVLSQKKIICFSSSTNTNQKTNIQTNSIKKNIQKCLKYSDGDLKIDLLLSLIRIQEISSLPSLDITKYYKYMQIQPFFIEYQNPSHLINKQNPLLQKYYFYRLIQKNRVKNVYLARSLQNGYFYSVKVYRSGLSMAEHEARFLTAINSQIKQRYPSCMKNQFLSQKFPQFQDAVVSKTQIHMIPSQQEQDQDEDSIQNKYKHLAIISKYNIKGKLSDKIHDKNCRITQNDLLRYLKQLVWIAYTLHQEYNIIHRNLTPQSFQINQSGDLKIVSFCSWVQCYSQDGKLINYPAQGNSTRSDFNHTSRIYEEQFQFASDGWYHIGHYTPPQVSHKSKSGYNKFVDYFTIGIVIKQIYLKVYEYQAKPQNNKTEKLIQKMISGLTSNNLKQRQEIVLQIIEGIKKSKSQQTQRKNKEIILNLNQIRLGKLINIDLSQTCIENQTNDLDFNGISHQQIINFFKPSKFIKQSLYEVNGSHCQTKKQVSNEKLFKEKKKNYNLLKISREEVSNVSNSRDKSVKSVKSNKSKDKTRTKSKLINTKNQKSQKVQIKQKSKSKSHKKMRSPQRNSFTNTGISGNTSKIQRVPFNHPSLTLNNQKSPKSKNNSKVKIQKSVNSKSKQKIQSQTILSGINKQNQMNKTMNRTGGHIVIPRPNYKYPGNHT